MGEVLNGASRIYSKLISLFTKLVLLSVMIIVCIGCCSKKQTNYSVNNLAKYLQNISSDIPINSINFVYMASYMKFSPITECDHEECKLEDIKLNLAAASGYIVKKDTVNKELYIVTAAHWCVDPDYPDDYNIILGVTPPEQPEILYNAYFLGENYNFDIIAYDELSDICIGKIKSEEAYRAENIEIAKDYPKIGEKVYSQSAPLGIYDKKTRYIFDGRFAGCNDQYCEFTLSATYGSSGSAIINESGEIVSLISASVIDFPFIAVGPKLEEINYFLKKYL